MFCLVDFNYGTTQTTLCPLTFLVWWRFRSVADHRPDLDMFRSWRTEPLWLSLETRAIPSWSRISVSEWQLPPSQTGQLSGAAPLTSSRGSLTSVSVIHYLPTRPGSVPPKHSCCQPWRNLAIFDP